MIQIIIYQDMDVQLNSDLASTDELQSEKQAYGKTGGAAENHSSSPENPFIKHSTNLAFVEEWQEETITERELSIICFSHKKCGEYC